MNMPGFTAEASLYLGGEQYRLSTNSVHTPGLVVQQDCSWYKSIGCVAGPFSWCVFAGFGGADTFIDCVNALSGGECLDCIGATEDPSGPLPSGLTMGAGVPIAPPEGRRGPGWSSQTEIDLRRQLNRIERCACGQTFLATPISPFD